MAKQATPKPTPADSFTARGAAIAYGLLGTITLAIRASHHQTAALIIGLPLGAVGAFAIFDYLEGPRRRLVGLAVGLDLTICSWIIWPAHPMAAWLLPLSLPAIGATLIGYRGGKDRRAARARTFFDALRHLTGKRAGAKAIAGFEAIRNHLPEGSKVHGTPASDTNGTVRIKFMVPSGAPKWDPNTAERNIATDLRKPRDLVKIYDLGRSRAGLHELVILGRQPFDLATKPKAPKPELGRVPLGYDGAGNIVWMNLVEGDAIHMLIAGTTGSGKSTFLRWLLTCFHFLKFEIWAGDPKGGKGLRASWCATRYARTDDECRLLLKDAHAEMIRREQIVGEDDWSGNWLIVVIDEFSAVADKTSAPWIRAIIKRGRSSKVALIGADQSARVGSVGGGDVKANFPTRVAFRTTGIMENGLILEENKPGFLSHEISRDTAGRCIVKGLPSVDWVAIQTWNVKPPTLTPGAPLPAPLPPPIGNVGTHVTRPPSNGDYAGQTPLPEASDTSDRNPQTEANGTDLDNTIAQLLAPINPATQTPIGRVLGALDGMARSTKAVGESVGISERQALTHLNNLATDGLALRVKGGWIRA